MAVGQLGKPVVNEFIVRGNGVRMRFVLNPGTGLYHNTRNSTLVGKISQGKFTLVKPPCTMDAKVKEAMALNLGEYSPLLDEPELKHLWAGLATAVMNNDSFSSGLPAFIKLSMYNMLRVYPDLAKRENIANLGEIIKLATRISARKDSHITFLAIFALSSIISHNPAIASSKDLHKFCEFLICLIEKLSDESLYVPQEKKITHLECTLELLKQLFDLNPSLSDVRHIGQLKRLVDLFVELSRKDLDIWQWLGQSLVTSYLLTHQMWLDNFTLMMRAAIKCTEKGYPLKSIVLDCMTPYLEASPEIIRPEYADRLAAYCSLVLKLADKGIFPTYQLVMAVAKGQMTMDDMAIRYKQLQRHADPFLSLTDRSDLDLFYSVVTQQMEMTGGTVGYSYFNRLVKRIHEWRMNDPEYSTISNFFPAFTVTGKGEIKINDSVFSCGMIDSHIRELLAKTEAFASVNIARLEDSPISRDERLQFARRVLACLDLIEAIREGKLPPEVKLTNRYIKLHMVRRRERFMRDISGTIALIDNKKSLTDLHTAVYCVAVASLNDSVNRKTKDSADHYARLIADILMMQGLRDPQLMSKLKEGTYQEKLEALRQVYEDRIWHIPRSSVPIPKQADAMIKQRMSELAPEYVKIGRFMQGAPSQEYSIVPAGYTALFRGYIGNDCSYEEDIPLWAFNPNNVYFLIKKGEKAKGYICLTKCATADERKFYIVDTMQPCPPGIVIPILRQLAELAKKQGFEGLVVGKRLKGSFNYDEVVRAIVNTVEFQEGEDINVGPLDENSWEDFEIKLGEDTYHSLNVNNWRNETLSPFSEMPGFVRLRI